MHVQVVWTIIKKIEGGRINDSDDGDAAWVFHLAETLAGFFLTTTTTVGGGHPNENHAGIANSIHTIYILFLPYCIVYICFFTWPASLAALMSVLCCLFQKKKKEKTAFSGRTSWDSSKTNWDTKGVLLIYHFLAWKPPWGFFHTLSTTHVDVLIIIR